MYSATLLALFALAASTLVNASSHMRRSSFTHHRRAHKRDDTPKIIAAHMMVGNTYPFGPQDWLDDINLAKANGIDAFALNIGTDEWQPGHVQDAYDAAAKANGFKIFISFDMTVLPCGSPDTAATLRNYITKYSSHPAQLKYDGRNVAGTFAGENCNFGQGSSADGWKSQFTEHPDLQGGNAVYFVPSFFVDPATFPQYSGVMDGVLNWNSAWSVEVNEQQVSSTLGTVGLRLTNLGASVLSAASKAMASVIGTFGPDTPYINGLKGVNAKGPKTYMATVSPNFFTHYGPQSFNKNFVYTSGDWHGFPNRWDTLIKNRDQVQMVELLTWNDFGESHYIGPIKGDQPNSQDWVDGFEHEAFLDMTKYYAAAFKTGTYPAINEDKVYLWSRSHPALATATSDSVPPPTDFDSFADVAWALVAAAAPATFTLNTGNGQSKTFDVQPGMNKLSLPISPGGTLEGTLTRNGQVVVNLKPDFTFEGNPVKYNYNFFAAMAGANSTGPN